MTVDRDRILGRLLALLLAAALFGCAAEKMNREASHLLDEGRYEEGLARLEAASRADPGNMSYRAKLSRSREQIVNRLLSQAEAARAAQHPDLARATYHRIEGIDPGNRRARDGLAMLEMSERHAKLLADAAAWFAKGNLDQAASTLKPVLMENPNDSRAIELQRRIDEAAANGQESSPELRAQFKKPVSLQFRDANLKMVFEALSRVSGINILLDKDVRPDLKTSIFVKDVSVEDTIDLILMQSELAKKVLNDNTVFVYPNTPAKIKDYQDLLIRSFHLTNADPKQMLTMLKTLLKSKDVFINEKNNSIVIRDTPDAVRLAEKLISDQDTPEPEVMLEVEVIEVNRSRLTDLGIKWPDQLTLTALGTANVPGAATPTTAPTLDQLRRINGTNILVSPAPSISLKALLQDSDTDILASPRIRARNREKAKIMIGDRVPVITNAVTPVATGAPVVTGNVQYLDVGLKLEVEPDIHRDREVAIKINLEVSSIVKEVANATSGTLAYQIGTRNASTLLQLKDGETQILGGLIDNEERSTANKVPGLGQMPMLGHLFSEHQGNGTKTEILLSITPHIVGNSSASLGPDMEYWSGTEASLHTAPLLLREASKLSLSNQSGSPYARESALAERQQPAARQPAAFSWSGPAQVKVGQRISLTLNSSGIGEHGLPLSVGFDPTALRAVEAVQSEIPGSGGAARKPQIDQALGRIRIDPDGPRPGAGPIATLVFEAIRPAGSTPITLGRAEPAAAGSAGFAAPAPYSIQVSE